MAERRITEYPNPGQSILIRAERDQDIVFDIDLSQADIQAEGRQVVFAFPDGGRIVLDFTDLGGASLPNIILADGTALSVQEYLASLSSGDVEPAAGPSAGAGSQGSGVGEYNDDPGQAIAGVDKLNGLDPRVFTLATQPELDGGRREEDTGVSPDAGNDGATLYESGQIVTGNLFANDTLGGASLVSITHNGVTYTAFGQSALVIGSALGGELTVDPVTGAFSYVSPGSLDHSGSESLPDEFIYTLDGPGGSSTGTLTLDILDAEPMARPDSNTASRGGNPVTGNILGNDSLDDGATLVHVGGREFGPDGTITIVTDSGGTLVISQNGDYTYTPPAGEGSSGFEDIFSYGLRDVDGDESSSTLTISVTGADPAASPDHNTVAEGGNAVSGNILSNDVLANGAILSTFDGRTFDGSGVLVITTPLGGVLRIQSNGDYTYTPPASADHSASESLQEVFGYALRDTDGRELSSTLTIDVTDTAPAASPDYNTVTEGGSAVSGNILGNDVLTDGASLSTFDGRSFDGSGVLVINTPLGGVLRIESNGDYTYTPPANVDPLSGNSVQEVFSYSLVDRDGDMAQSTLTIDVTDVAPVPPTPPTPPTPPVPPTPPTPQVVPDVNSVSEGSSAINGNILVNDSLTGTTLTSFNGQPVPLAGLVIPTPLGGQLEIYPNGDYTYTPPASADHSASDPLQEVFNYTLTDSDGNPISSTLTINVGDAFPAAIDDVNSVTEGAAPVSGNVLGNDTPVDNAGITQITHNGVTYMYNAFSPSQTIVTTEGGSLVLNFETGAYSYTPPAHLDHSGGEISEQFTYTLADRDGDSDTATLTITVEDTKPVANNDLHRFAVTNPDATVEVTGNVITGVGGGADTPSQDNPLSITGWYDGAESQSLPFDSNLDIGVWQTLASGNQFRWDDADGNYTYRVVPGSTSWKTLYDKVAQPDVSTLNIRADGVDDNSPANVASGTFTGQVHSSSSGLGVEEAGGGGTLDPAETIDFIGHYGVYGTYDQALIVDLDGPRSFIKLGLAPRTAPGYEGKDQFVLDLYDQNGNLIGTDNNGGEFFLVEDFTANAIRSFEVGGVAKTAAYVGIRAMPTEEQWANDSTAMPLLGDHSSSFYLTHLSVYDNSQDSGDKITYRLSDSDSSTDAATLTLTPLYNGEMP